MTTRDEWREAFAILDRQALMGGVQLFAALSIMRDITDCGPTMTELLQSHVSYFGEVESIADMLPWELYVWTRGEWHR